MDANLKKLRDSALDSNLIDLTMYRQLIGSLMYLTNTIEDICFVVNSLSQVMCEPRQIHWIAAKHVLRYLRGTVGYSLRYDSECDLLFNDIFGHNTIQIPTEAEVNRKQSQVNREKIHHIALT